MLGGERLRGLLISPHEKGAGHVEEPETWLHMGLSPVGEEVWEHLFQVSPLTSFQVAVHLDPGTGRIRTFYTALSEGDKFPEIPSPVRRKVEAFKERIRSAS